MSLRVLLCASEVVPFVKTGGLADVAGALPKALAALGHDVRLVLPGYAAVDKKKFPSRKVRSLTVPLGGKSVSVTLRSSEAIPGVPTYLIDSPKHFSRDGLYGEPDDGERFALFCRAIVELARQHDWCPQVIHGNDWQTGLLPVYLKRVYAQDEKLADVATLHTVHNLAYQGVFEPSVLEAAGLDAGLFTVDNLEFYGQVNFLKGALIFADLLSTVSQTYSREIQTSELGERLEGVLAKRKDDLFGVLNGLDYEEWNPAADPHISAHYDASAAAPKAENKAALQQRLGLPERPEAPLFGMVSRLASQKGLDILGDVLPHLLGLDAQVAVLGTGDPYYHHLMSDLADRYPDKMAAVLDFDNPLAHQIYAGCDFFLMPSRYEPCGLGQMISLRYGTIPIVRRTGGLADTITDFDAHTGEGNGFSFKQYSAVALMGAISRALLTMQTRPAWSRLVRNAMNCDFSWGRSANEYVDLYRRAIERHRG